jgi:uncharacterized protein
MSSLRRIPVLLLGLTACVRPAAGAQPAPPADPPAGTHGRQVPGGLAQTSEQTAPTIEVTGSASVAVPSDVARVSFAVETHAKEAGSASAANAQDMSRVIAALKQADLPGLRVETFGYQLNPEYSTSPPQDPNGRQTREIVGYAAVNNIRVTLTEVQSVGRAVDAAIGAGANRVASLSFEASETTEARKEALSEAVAEARSQAQTIADALGRELGPPIEIHGGAQNPQPIRPMMFEGARAAASTPVEAAEQSVSASVTIRFALGPEKAGR